MDNNIFAYAGPFSYLLWFWSYATTFRALLQRRKANFYSAILVGAVNWSAFVAFLVWISGNADAKSISSASMLGLIGIAVVAILIQLFVGGRLGIIDQKVRFREGARPFSNSSFLLVLAIYSGLPVLISLWFFFLPFDFFFPELHTRYRLLSGLQGAVTPISTISTVIGMFFVYMSVPLRIAFVWLINRGFSK